MRLPALFFLVALASGCVSPPGNLKDDPEVAVALERARLRPHPRLALAPARIEYAETANLDDDPTRFPARIASPDAFTGELADGLALAIGPVARAPAPDPRDPGAPFREARRQGAELLAVVRFESFDDLYLGRFFPTWIPNVALWAYLLFPSWLVPDERYGARARGSFDIYGVASERPLRSVPFDVSVDHMLDDFDRGFDWFHALFGIFTVPKSLEPDNYRAVGEVLDPHALYGVRKACVLEAAGPLLDALDSGELERRDATTFALVVSASGYADPEIRAPAGAANDGAAVAKLLEGMGVPAKNVTRLEGARATREEIVKALDGLASAARPGDDVFVYFSGCGASLAAEGEGADCYLVTQDASRATLGTTALSFRALGRSLGKVRARSIVVALDAAFGGAGARSAGLPAAPGAEAALARLSGARSGIAVFAATVPGGATMDLAGAGERGGAAGLFTFALVEGAGRAADLDQDGRVGMGELAAYLAREAAAEAGIEGIDARPGLYRGGRRADAGPARGEASWLTNWSEKTEGARQ